MDGNIGQKEAGDPVLEDDVLLEPSFVVPTKESKSQYSRPLKRLAQFPHKGCFSSH